MPEGQIALISVIMPVFNGQKYLAEAIESILYQTFPHYEFIIIDDASSDKSLPIAQHYAKLDPRIRLIHNNENVGIAKSLNKGIELAKGFYIARMDADDISLPDRFQKQVDFLEENPHIAVLGGAFIYIDASGTPSKQVNYFPRPNQVRWKLFFGNHLAHPTIMMRADLFKQHGIHYNETLQTTQDYDLWVNIVQHHQLANLPDVLIYYREHNASVSSRLFGKQKNTHIKIRGELISRTVKLKFSDSVVEGIRDPRTLKTFGTCFQSLILLLLLQRSQHLASIEMIDREFIKKDIAYRIGKIWHRSKKNPLLLPFRMFGLKLQHKRIMPLMLKKNRYRKKTEKS